VYAPKIMKIGWQLTKLLQKLSGLLFLAHPVNKTASASKFSAAELKSTIALANEF